MHDGPVWCSQILLVYTYRLSCIVGNESRGYCIRNCSTHNGFYFLMLSIINHTALALHLLHSTNVTVDSTAVNIGYVCVHVWVWTPDIVDTVCVSLSTIGCGKKKKLLTQKLKIASENAEGRRNDGFCMFEAEASL